MIFRVFVLILLLSPASLFSQVPPRIEARIRANPSQPPTTFYQESSIRYIGDVANGYADGKGILYWRFAGKKQYEGDFKNGYFDGRGRSFDRKGIQKYSGEFKQGLYHGAGSLYDIQGNVIYEGSFQNGKIAP